MSRKVAVAGGSGTVAQDVIEAILRRGKYQVVILSRSDGPKDNTNGIEWAKVDYDNKFSLVEAFAGVDTVLSFIATADIDSAVKTHMVLIDAAIEAGVRRFAPSEWATKIDSGVHHYAWKDDVRRYLEEVNRERKRIEYCLFQPGFFTNYFAYPHATAKHFHVCQMFADFDQHRMITLQDRDFSFTLTTVEDLCEVVSLALEYPSEWPVVGGIQGTQISVSELLTLGEKLRGPFKVEKVSESEMMAGNLETSWYPVIDHHQIPVEAREQVSKAVLKEYLKSLAEGKWSTSDEWNTLLPYYKFTTAEEYLSSVWLKGTNRIE